MLRLVYFNRPGRAAPTRLMLSVAERKYEEVIVSTDDWPIMKETTPGGQLPVLYLPDGRILTQLLPAELFFDDFETAFVGTQKLTITAYLSKVVRSQSRAIHEYVAKDLGFYAQDAWKAAVGMQAVSLTDDLAAIVHPLKAAKGADAKAAALAAILDGSALRTKVHALQAVCACEKGDYLAGDQLTWADFALYCFLSQFVSGFNGLPLDLWDSFPEIKAYRNTIAQVPGVKAYMAARRDDPSYKSYQPDTV